ncbi:SIMPL domain-containing protein [Amnibacterium flavum]|nr:SIMPL domain-containing protein [Amnibacterium flavum]
MVDISVAGEATTHVPAERGTPRLTVSIEGPDRAAVLARASELHHDLSEQARQQVGSGAATRWTADSIWVRSEDRYIKDSDTPVRTEVATVDLTVRFRDFGAMSEWVEHTAAREGIQLGGVEWSLTDATLAEARSRVRVAAVRDAQDRARAYSDALGLQEVVLERVWEAGLRPGGDSGAPLLRKAFSATASASIDLKPADIEVSAAITADFVAH